MSDIKFECPDCAQHITAPEEMLNMEVDCPSCARKVKVRRSAQPPPRTPEPKPNVAAASRAPDGVKHFTLQSRPLLAALLAIGCAVVFLLYEQVRALNRLASPHWEYKVLACQDYTDEANKYARELLAAKKTTEDKWLEEVRSNDKYYNGRFHNVSVDPGSDWELCAWFLEPRTDHPKLILIFKRPS
jgi:hypothetical protein